jgi:hypothetical protein
MITFGNIVACLANRHVITPFRIEADARISSVSTIEPYDSETGQNTVRVGSVSQYAALEPGLRTGNFVLATDIGKGSIPSEPWANIACVPDTGDIAGIVSQLEALLGRAAKPMLRERLFAMLLDGDDVSAIADVVSQLVGNPVVVANAAFDVVAASHGAGEASVSLFEPVDVDGSFEGVFEGGDGVRRLVRRLSYADSLVGYFVVVERFVRLGSCNEDTYSLCARVLAKQLSCGSRQPLHREPRVSFEHELLLDLVSGRVRSELEFRERASSVGLDVGATWLTACFVLGAYASDAQILRARIESVVEGSRAVLAEGRIVVVAALDGSDEIDGFKSQVELVAGAEDLRAGISDPFPDLYELPTRADEAEKAVRLANLLHKSGRICEYGRFRIPDLLSQVDSDRLVRFADPAIVRLAADDEAAGEDLFETFRAYLQHGCSVTETARACYIHRNTVGYRIAQIETRYGLDPSDPELRPGYTVSCLVVEYLRALRGSSATGSVRLFRNK